MASLKGRLFARLSLDYEDHPKIAALSDAAFRAHVGMILYARRYETDGVIPRRLAVTRWGTDSVTELLTNDERSPSLVELPSGDYLLHGYADMQETRGEIDARREVNARNGAKGGRPRKTQSVTDSVADSGTQKKAETETETEVTTRAHETAPATPSTPPGFDQFWAAYPRSENWSRTLRAYKTAVQESPVTVIVGAAQNVAAWHKRQNTEQRFIKGSGAWLEGRHWMDDNAKYPPPRELEEWERRG